MRIAYTKKNIFFSLHSIEDHCLLSLYFICISFLFQCAYYVGI